MQEATGDSLDVNVDAHDQKIKDTKKSKNEECDMVLTEGVISDDVESSVEGYDGEKSLFTSDDEKKEDDMAHIDNGAYSSDSCSDSSNMRRSLRSFLDTPKTYLKRARKYTSHVSARSIPSPPSSLEMIKLNYMTQDESDVVSSKVHSDTPMTSFLPNQSASRPHRQHLSLASRKRQHSDDDW